MKDLKLKLKIADNKITWNLKKKTCLFLFKNMCLHGESFIYPKFKLSSVYLSN